MTSHEFPLAMTPLTVGRHELKHRVVMTPHGVAWPGGNLPFDRQRQYYVERARGGTALVQTGATALSRRHRVAGNAPTTCSDEAVVPLYERFSDEVHQYGAKLFVELAESGVHERGRRVDGEWGTVLGVSALPSMVQNEAPVVIDRNHLRELREDHVLAARNLLRGGVDGITIHAGHSYLLGQFMSPAYNDRQDEYGGSVVNNLRIIREIVRDVRDEVGDRMAIGLRISYDEFLGDAGITPDLSDEYMAVLCDDGDFDFYDISAGGYHTGERYVPPQVLPWAPIAEYARRAKTIAEGRAVILMAHRVNTLKRAEELLAAGVTDLVGIARGHIAEPELVNKTLEGRQNEINLCVGSNECVYNLHMGMGVACTVNPSTGREARWGIGTMTKAATSKNVVIVGAGPAGLKAAQVAVDRGHSVTVLERSSTPGGSLELLASLPHHRQWQALTDQLVARLENAGVDIEFGVDATPQSILDRRPDAVVVATGSRWDRLGRSPARPARDGIEGIEQSDRVYTIDEAVQAHRKNPGVLGSNIVMLDETGAYLPLGAAELFTDDLAANTAVTIITRRHMVGEIAKETWELPLLMKRISGRSVNLLPHSVIESIDQDVLSYRGIWETETRRLAGVTALVICGLRYANRELFDQLDGAVPEVHLIGDSLAPRRPADAVYDGERVGRLL